VTIAVYHLHRLVAICQSAAAADAAIAAMDSKAAASAAAIYCRSAAICTTAWSSLGRPQLHLSAVLRPLSIECRPLIRPFSVLAPIAFAARRNW